MSVRPFLALALALALVPGVALAVPPLAPDDATPVTIKRDASGVPHVYADDLYGLFWGNGYAQAQDRLFQMDVLRHVGKGESARVLGPSQLDMDLATRRELYTDAERLARWEALPEADRTTFQGFADGVNAWIRETERDPTLLSAEFYAIGHKPEDWHPTDTIAIAEFLLDIFGAGSGGNELDNARLLDHLMDTLGPVEAEKAFDDLFWMHHPEAATTLDPADYTYAVTEGPLDFADIPAEQWALVDAAAGAKPFAGPESFEDAVQRTLGLRFGSNAIVVSPALSENGAALLLGGPQMAYFNPMIPYEVALHGAGFDTVGMGVGGAPGVIIGRNQHLAWTVTSGSSDQVDVVAERLVPGDPRQYYVGTTPTDMDCRREVHVGPPTAIDQKPPVLATQEVCRTARGPVFAINEDAGYAFVRERTHRGDELRSGILWLMLGKNADLASFEAHMQTFRFEFNFHVAADDGDIAYYHWGGQPVRAEGYDPRLPRVAGLWDWTEVRTGNELPHKVNPAKGYIANWNNKPAQGWSSGDAMEKWGPENRVELIEAAIAAELADDGSLSIADLHEINEWISTRSPYPSQQVPALLAATATSTDADVQAARAALAAWAATGYSWMPTDATCKIARAPDDCFGTMPVGFTVYEAWRRVAQGALFADELGPHMRKLELDPPTSGDPHAADFGREDNKENVLVEALQGATAHDWLDATPEAFLAATFETAVAKLVADHGSVTAAKARGKTIEFSALSGGPAWRIAMVNRPSFNHWYDWGTGAGGSVLPPGTDQSWSPPDFLRFRADGTLPDPHKDDQLKLYVDFDYKPAQLGYATWASTQTFMVDRDGPLA